MQIGEALAASAFLALPGVLDAELADHGLSLSDAMARRMVGAAHDAALVRAREESERQRKFRESEARARRESRR